MDAYDYLLKGREEMNRYWRSWDQNAVNRAEEYFKKAFELDPDSELAKAQYWANMANIYLQRNSRITESYLKEDYLDSVIWYCNNATSIAPEAIWWPMLGEAYYNRGDIDLAIKEYEKWLEMKPETIGALWYLGLIKVLTNDYINGISMIKKAVKLSESKKGGLGYPHWIFRLGLAYRALGDFEKAEFYVDKANELGAWCYLTSLYPIYQGNHQEALDLLESSDCQCGCEFQKGEIYLQMKDYEKAIESFKFLRNWAKDNKRKDLMGYGSEREGFAMQQVGKHDEGNELIEKDFQKAKQAHELGRPDDHDYVLAAIYTVRNEPDLALKHLKEYENQVVWGDIIYYVPPLEYSQTDIMFENLWDLPDYKELIKKYKEKKAAIRDLLRQLEGTEELD
jgi:tetratricopeptide (TPR) repeat protein